MDLNSLDVFCAVVNEGGIVRAAEKLNRVQSNVTTRIKQLEQRLGVSLFRRRGRSLELTPQGADLLVHAERLLRLADEAELSVRGSNSLRPLRLGSMESTAASRLPKILAALHRSKPSLKVELQTGTTAQLIQRVQDYRLDAAFVGEPFERNGLNVRSVFREELILVTSADHPPVTQSSDLHGQTLITFGKGCSYRTIIENWISEAVVKPSRISEFSSYHAIAACVAANGGYGIIPASVLETLSLNSAIRKHKLPDGITMNRTYLVWNDEYLPSISALLDQLPLFEAGMPSTGA